MVKHQRTEHMCRSCAINEAAKQCFSTIRGLIGDFYLWKDMRKDQMFEVIS